MDAASGQAALKKTDSRASLGSSLIGMLRRFANSSSTLAAPQCG
jgi:hypothetical protein